MNTVEEKLWNYIDGNSSPEEHKAISLLIEQDEAYRKKYRELLALNAEFSAMELDEPPMAFTYKVMETIRNEHALIPLKTRIDQRIIKGIGIFFVFTITILLIYALASVNWSAGGATKQMNFSLPDVTRYFSGPVMQCFWFFDSVLALYLIDNYLRKKVHTKSNMSVQSDGQTTKH